MKLIVDAQLPPALAAALREAGCDAVAVRDIGLLDAVDAAIWKHAVEHQAAILTKDEDFAERCLAVGRAAPVVVWLRLGNASTARLLSWFIPLLPRVLERIQAGDQLIEVR